MLCLFVVFNTVDHSPLFETLLPRLQDSFCFSFFFFSYSLVFLELSSGLTPPVGFSMSKVVITQEECKGSVKCIINMTLSAVAYSKCTTSKGD